MLISDWSSDECSSDLCDTDVDVPVLMFLTETGADGATAPFGMLRPVSWAGAIGGLVEFLGGLPGAGPLRVPISEAPSPDHDHLRVWEIAGGAHGDQAFLAYAVAELTQDLLAPLQIGRAQV